MSYTESIITSDGERLLPVRPDVCERLGGVSRSTVYELFARGDLPSVKLANRRMVRESDLQAFIASLDS